MNKINILLLYCIFGVSTIVSAQQQEVETTQFDRLKEEVNSLEGIVKSLQKLKLSGYIITQYQYGEKDAALKVGTPNETDVKDPKPFSRFGVRGGRIRFLYEEGIVQGIFMPNFTDRAISVAEIYLKIKDPWTGTNSISSGIFNRPFGHEIDYSSSLRESPERSTVIQTLFPDEADLGVMLTLQAAKTSPWNILKFEGGLFAGNGIKPQSDSKPDFIGHLSASKNIGSNLQISGGISYYRGSVIQGTDRIYSVKNSVFTEKTGRAGEYSKREYLGFDLRLSLMTGIGMTQFRSEYIFGQQPGSKDNSKYPTDVDTSGRPGYDTYLRNVSGGYVILVQDLGLSPLSAVIKYDWFNPNTDLSGEHIKSRTEATVNTLGFGILWTINKNVRLQANYEINGYEKAAKSLNLSERKENVFTLRLRFKI